MPNQTREYLAFAVTGAADIAVFPFVGQVPAGPFAFGDGRIYEGAGVAGKQGASEDFSGRVPTNGFIAITSGPTVSTSVVVWEGK
jgi:hypothetical protein